MINTLQTKIELNSMIEKYLNCNNQRHFEEVKQALVEYKEYDIPMFAVENLCTSKHSNNPYHLGFFHLLSKRLLEANYYFKKNLEKFPNDSDSWILLQYVSAKQGDIQTSIDAIKKIDCYCKDFEKYRALVIHYMAIGNIPNASNIATYLINTNNRDYFTLLVIYEICLLSKQWDFISYLLNCKIGRDLLKIANERKSKILRKIVISKILNMLSSINEKSNE